MKLHLKYHRFYHPHVREDLRNSSFTSDMDVISVNLQPQTALRKQLDYVKPLWRDFGEEI
jgi:hypothetical protein